MAESLQPSDPFSILGVDRTLHLDERALERTWIKATRLVHPDHLGDVPADEQAAALQRAADLNVAYRTLKDRWSRAEALCETLDPGVLERTKTLPPAFLMEAMETAEAVQDVAPDSPDADKLEQSLVAACAEWFRAVATAADAEATEEAATALHKSRYDRKALSDLLARRAR